MASPSAIIVGAGAGGIATAARLAKDGWKVTVVEKQDFIGGRCSLIHRDGYRFDQGPSLLLMPEVFHQTFHDLDTTLAREAVQLLKCDPNYAVWFADSTCFELSTDLCKMGRQIEQIEQLEGSSSSSSSSGKGLQGFFSFMSESGKHYDLSMAHVMSQNFPQLVSMLRPRFLASVFTMHPFESIYSRVGRYFASEKLRRVFTFGSMYLGMSPFDAPGTYSLLQYTELAHGILYPVGGFQKVLEALAKVGQRFGVDFQLNTPVSSIIVSKDNIARGVRLESGKELLADTVIINADLVYAYNNLLPPSRYSKSLSKRPASCSSISFFWSFDRTIPELQGHNIFLANEYKESFDAIFKRHHLPEEPSFYVNVPSRIDPTAAPAGKDAVVVLVPVGHIVDDDESVSQDWDALVKFAREVVLNTIEARTGARGLRESLIKESVDTPPIWKERFNLDRGAILGLSHSFFNVLSFRPKNKHSDISGLYFVGASTHPGTGVPVCLAGSKIVHEQIVQDWAQKGKPSRLMALSSVWLAVLSALLPVLMWFLSRFINSSNPRY